MNKIIIITNMEQKYTNLLQSKNEVYVNNEVSLELHLLNDTEPWNKKWESEIYKAEFVLFSWMGTGLCCQFLKQASSFMQKNDIKHYIKIMDAGDDLLEKGIAVAEKNILLNYLNFG